MTKVEEKMKMIMQNPALSESEKKSRLEELQGLKSNPAALVVSIRIVNRIRGSCRKCHYLLVNTVLGHDEVINPDLLCDRCKRIYDYEMKR